MNARACLRSLLVLMLLIAQQLALAHPLLHLQNGAPVQTAGDTSDHNPATSACDFHAVYAQVICAIDAAAPALACVCKTAEPRDGVRTAAGFAARVVAVSRGPPVSH